MAFPAREKRRPAGRGPAPPSAPGGSGTLFRLDDGQPLPRLDLQRVGEFRRRAHAIPVGFFRFRPFLSVP